MKPRHYIFFSISLAVCKKSPIFAELKLTYIIVNHK